MFETTPTDTRFEPNSDTTIAVGAAPCDGTPADPTTNVGSTEEPKTRTTAKPKSDRIEEPKSDRIEEPKSNSFERKLGRFAEPDCVRVARRRLADDSVTSGSGRAPTSPRPHLGPTSETAVERMTRMGETRFRMEAINNVSTHFFLEN